MPCVAKGDQHIEIDLVEVLKALRLGLGEKLLLEGPGKFVDVSGCRFRLRWSVM